MTEESGSCGVTAAHRRGSPNRLWASATSNSNERSSTAARGSFIWTTAWSLCEAVILRSDLPTEAADYIKVENLLLRQAQLESFPEEVKALISNRPLPNSSPLGSLSPEYDQETGLLRVRGRLRRAEQLEPDAIHPVLLDPKHLLTHLSFRILMKPSCILDQRECWQSCVVGFGSYGGGKWLRDTRDTRVTECNARHGVPILPFPRWQVCHLRVYASINHPSIRLESIALVPSQ